MHTPRWLSAIALCVLLSACGSGKSATPAAHRSTPGALQDLVAAPQPAAALPESLPADGVQPWEHLDAGGHVAGPARRSSLANASSVFATGADTFSSAASATVVGDATRLATGLVGQQLKCYAVYRLAMGGSEPGVVVFDVDVTSSTSSYFVAVGDFSTGRWQWRGPFSGNKVRLSRVPGQLDSSNYVSPLGDLFACVAVYDGSRADVVGVGAEPITAGDAAVPPAPTAFTAQPVPGGLMLQWTPGSVPDLAGYRVLWSSRDFTAASDPGVNGYGYGVTGGQLFLPAPPRLTFVAVQTVDLAGNTSPLSSVENALPVAGVPFNVSVKLTKPAVTVGTALKLTAAGCTTYDFDMDDDGTYEVLGAASGDVNLDTTQTGLFRINVRGHNASQVGLSGASVLVTGNTPPTASANADPLSGTAPLNVDLSATASDAEDLPAALTYAWDYDGDGIYEIGTNSLTLQRTYGKAGTYTAMFKVTDTGGASATAPVTITVARGVDQVPFASFTVTAQQDVVPLALSYNFDATGSSDPDDDPLLARWDYDNTGLGGAFPLSQIMNHVYPSMGSYLATVQVDDGLGGKKSASQMVYVPSVACSFYGAPRTFTHQSPILGTQNSHLKWVYRTGDIIDSTPVISPTGNVYVTSQDHKLYALTDNGTQTPTIKWRFTAIDGITSTPAIGPDGTVYVGSADHKVYALQENGQQAPDVKWSFATNDSVVASPLVGPDGTVYVGSDDFTLYALKDNGSLIPDVKWSFVTGSAIEASPAIGPDGTVYVCSFDRTVYALTDNGSPTPTVKWSYLTGGAIASSPAIGPDGTIYVGSFDGSIYALKDNSTPVPDLKWSFVTGAGIYSSPAVAANAIVYVGSQDGSVYALVDNGTPTPNLQWSYATGGPINGSTPIIGLDNTVYIGSSDKAIYALIDNGTAIPTVKWKYITGDVINGNPAIGPDGTVYCGSEDNFVYAFGQ